MSNAAQTPVARCRPCGASPRGAPCCAAASNTDWLQVRALLPTPRPTAMLKLLLAPECFCSTEIPLLPTLRLPSSQGKKAVWFLACQCFRARSLLLSAVSAQCQAPVLPSPDFCCASAPVWRAEMSAPSLLHPHGGVGSASGASRNKLGGTELICSTTARKGNACTPSGPGRGRRRGAAARLRCPCCRRRGSLRRGSLSKAWGSPSPPASELQPLPDPCARGEDSPPRCTSCGPLPP